MKNIKEKYEKEIKEKMMKEFGYKNVMEIPTLVKISLNSGVGEATSDSSVIDKVAEDFAMITGQKPVKVKARKAISNFKVRQGDEIGVMVTLRRKKMWDFFDKLVNVVLPRIRDFRGIERKFDGNGNYSLGITEHTIFPEVDTTKVDKLRGLQVVIVTSAKTDKEGEKLLELLGMPFKKVVNDK